MTKHLSIQYIVQELTNNAGDRERFNTACAFEPEAKLAFSEKVITFDFEYFDNLHPIYQEHIIRTALSRVNGKAVLSALEVVKDHYFRLWEKQQLEELDKSDATFGKNSETSKRILAELSYERYKYACTLDYLLYQAFDTPLRNGEGLEKALEALDQYFIEEGEIIKLNVK